MCTTKKQQQIFHFHYIHVVHIVQSCLLFVNRLPVDFIFDNFKKNSPIKFKRDENQKERKTSKFFHIHAEKWNDMN